MRHPNKLIAIASISSDGFSTTDSNGQLLLSSPQYAKFFENKTLHQNIVMDTAAFNSLNNTPLPDRKNILITQEKINTPHKSIYFTNSYLNAFRSVTFENERDIYVIGDVKTHLELIPMCDELYLTVYDIELFLPNHHDSIIPFPYSPDLQSYGFLAPSFSPATPLSKFYHNCTIAGTLTDTKGTIYHFTK